MKIRLLAAAYVSAVVLIVVLADGSATQGLFAPVRALPLGDKCGHFLLMGLLALLVNLSVGRREWRVGRLSLLKGTLAVLLLVTLEEFSQVFIRSRTFDLVDLLFDCGGILCFDLCARRLWHRQARASLRS